MKSLLLLLVIYILQNFARSQDGPPIIYKSYPKKVLLGPEAQRTFIVGADAGYKKYKHLKREPFTRFEPPPPATVPQQKQLNQFFKPELFGDLKSRVKKVAYFSDRELSRIRRDVSNTTLTAQSKSNKTNEKPTTNKTEIAKSTPKPSTTTKLALKSKTTVTAVRSVVKDNASNATSSGGAQKASKSKDIERQTSLTAVPSPRSIILVDPKPARKNIPSAHKTKNHTRTKRNRRKQSSRKGRKKSPKGRKNSPKGQKDSPKGQKDSPKGQKDSVRAEKTPKDQKIAKRNQTPKAAWPNGRRLIAANDARPSDYPYMVSIMKDNVHWCSGAILNPTLIISTANCFWKATYVSRMKVRAGTRYTDRGGQVVKIAEVRKHPKWSLRKEPDCDIALALLAKYLKFSDAVHHVDLPNIAMLPPFDDAWVTSYGSERRDGIYNRVRLTLQVVYVRIMTLEKCNNITSRFNVPITDNFICMSQDGRRAPCTRDTGAPAVSDGVLWGLASWGLRKLCGTERFPAMFSYTGSKDNLDFLTNATSHLMSEHRGPKFLDRSNPFAAAAFGSQLT